MAHVREQESAYTFETKEGQRIRVKVEYEDGALSNYAYIAAMDGTPVATIRDAVLPPDQLRELGGRIVSSDRALLKRLEGVGYSTRVSDPTGRWCAANMRRVAVELSKARYDALADYCKRNGLSVNAAIVRAIEGMMEVE